MTSPEPLPPEPGAAHAWSRRIGVFDSGVGGLSVLRALHPLAGGAELLYVADSGHAPYGERGDDFVIGRARLIARFLVEQGCAVLVVACNTATAAAVQELRQAYPAHRIVGVEPGIKPAAASSRNHRIGVMATEGTLRSEKFRRLAEQHAGQATLVLQPCPGLAAAIERGEPEAPEVRDLIERHCAPLREAGVDTVVLGCTHYPFVADLIARALGPQVDLVDTAEAVARQAVRQLDELTGAAEARPSSPSAEPARLWTTGSTATLQAVARHWLGFPTEVQAAPFD
jgi:glutamate racemase